MKLLLDTHAFLQLCQEPASLPRKARDAAEGDGNEVYLSIASPWEMQIKVGLGNLHLAKSPRDLVQFEVDRGAITLLPISLLHINELLRLPSIHRDPFDRILIAQARCEGMRLVSGDGWVRQYPVDCLWD